MPQFLLKLLIIPLLLVSYHTYADEGDDNQVVDDLIAQANRYTQGDDSIEYALEALLTAYN